jgi:putative membrane protein
MFRFKSKPTPNQNEYPSFLASALAFNGSVTPKVLTQVLWVFVYALIVSIVNIYIPHAKMPIGPFEYAGFVMGLILVFRINAGYDRWWEARKIWGSIVNKSRNLTILLLNNSKNCSAETLAKYIKYIAATPFCIKKRLRDTHDFSDLKHLIDEETIDELNHNEHPVLHLSAKLSKFINHLVESNHLNEFSYLKAEEYRAQIIDDLGACERILKTPMPFVMAIKARRFILLFIIVLPWALVNTSIFVCPLISSLVAYTFFSLDQIGIELQNPFWETNLSHLPLTKISQTIEKNVLGLLRTHQSSKTE